MSAAMDTNRTASERDAFQNAFRTEYEKVHKLKALLKRCKGELPISPAGQALRAEIDEELRR